MSVEDHWKTSQLEDQRPEHSIIKFMTYDRFQLLLVTSGSLTIPNSLTMTTFLSSFNALSYGLNIFNLQQQSFVIRAHILP